MKRGSTQFVIKHMQIKSHREIPLYTNHTKCCQEYRGTRTPLCFWLECEVVQQLWKIVWSFLKKLNIHIPSNRSFHSKVLSKEKESICSYEDLYLNAPSKFTGNSPNWKKPKCPLPGEWRSKVQHIHTMEF